MAARTKPAACFVLAAGATQHMVGLPRPPSRVLEGDVCGRRLSRMRQPSRANASSFLSRRPGAEAGRSRARRAALREAPHGPRDPTMITWVPKDEEAPIRGKYSANRGKAAERDFAIDRTPDVPRTCAAIRPGGCACSKQVGAF